MCRWFVDNRSSVVEKFVCERRVLSDNVCETFFTDFFFPFFTLLVIKNLRFFSIYLLYGPACTEYITHYYTLDGLDQNRRDKSQ
jgi:hypothetical protein